MGGKVYIYEYPVRRPVSQSAAAAAACKPAGMRFTEVAQRSISGNACGVSLAVRIFIALALFAVYLFACASARADAPNPPTITPDYGVFWTTQSVSMSAPGATIRYTLDGQDPDESSPIYTSALSIGTTTTIKAIAITDNGTSSIATAYIQIDPHTANVPRTNLHLWLKADNNVSLSGSNVTQWRNMANGEYATQSSSSDQPTWSSNEVNGLPAVSFDGLSQFLNLGSGYSFSSARATMFVVTKPAAVASGARFFEFGNGTDNNNVFLSQPNDTDFSLHVFNGTSGSSITAQNAVELDEWQLLEAAYTGSAAVKLLKDQDEVTHGTDRRCCWLPRYHNRRTAHSARQHLKERLQKS